MVAGTLKYKLPVPLHGGTDKILDMSSQNQLDTKSQAWSALFSEPMSELVKRYTASVFFDKRLWQADITGSLAHADMLATKASSARKTWPTYSVA